MTGSPSNRTTMRSSRTPPFVIIALLIIVGFLSYNYWRFFNENSELRAEVELVRVQARELDTQKIESEKQLKSVRDEIAEIQKRNKDELTKKVQELTGVSEDNKKKQEELESVKKNLATCDGNLQAKQKELDTLKGQKAEVDKNLEEEKNKAKTCDLKSCIEPVKPILEIASKLAGTDRLSKAFTEAKLDSAALLQNVAQYPNPDAKPAE